MRRQPPFRRSARVAVPHVVLRSVQLPETMKPLRREGTTPRLIGILGNGLTRGSIYRNENHFAGLVDSKPTRTPHYATSLVGPILVGRGATHATQPL